MEDEERCPGCGQTWTDVPIGHGFTFADGAWRCETFAPISVEQFLARTSAPQSAPAEAIGWPVLPDGYEVTGMSDQMWTTDGVHWHAGPLPRA